MKLNKYKFKDSDNEFLIYTLTEELSMPLDDLSLELIEENPDLETNKLLPLIKAEDLLERLVKRSRTRDTVLSEESIRDFINDKYSEIVNNYEFFVDDTSVSDWNADNLSTE